MKVYINNFTRLQSNEFLKLFKVSKSTTVHTRQCLYHKGTFSGKTSFFTEGGSNLCSGRAPSAIAHQKPVREESGAERKFREEVASCFLRFLQGVGNKRNTDNIAGDYL